MHLQVALLSVDPSTRRVVQRLGHLYLVDLAGSERVHRTEASGEALAEGIHINSSLSSLIDVIQQASKGPQAVARHPGIFRQSLLTKVLKHAFGGNSKTYLVANCSPDPQDLVRATRLPKPQTPNPKPQTL